MNLRLFFILSALCTGICLPIHSNDSLTVKEEKKGILKKIYEYFEKSNEVNNEKRFDISFIGGPHYSKDTKVGIGMVASGLYRVDRNDLELSPSDVSLYGDVTTSGSYVIGISGNTLFPKDKYRINTDMYFSSTPNKYWGIGYNKGNDEDNYSKYTKKEMLFKSDFLKRIAKNTYAGIVIMGHHIRGSNFKDKTYLEGSKINNTAVGGGFLLSYDSRDFIPNPYSGIYIKYEHNFFPEFIGSTSNFNRIDFVTRYYKRIWKDGTIAFDLHGVFNNGDVPWSMVALMGGAYQMRGYYKGQYRDKKIIETQVEIRQRIYRRSGAVLWAGAGNIFPSFDNFEWNHTLPSFGLGYRWEFKNRVNVRLDYGIGKGQTSFYFNINEAF